MPGVYLFRTSKGCAIYVGQSGDVFQRYRQHRRKKWFAEDLEFWALEIEGQSDRLVAETVLILRERPLQNRAVKLGLRKDGSVYPLDWR